MAKIEVDGRSLEVEDGIMLIQATDAAGIHIPRFCYHEKLSIAANCRMCLVEVENAPKPLPACATPVADGMKVFTQSEIAREAQKGTMEFLLLNHPLDCPVCDQGGECPLQDQAVAYGKDISRFNEAKRTVPSQDIGPLIQTYMTRCILCTRCARYGEEIAGVMELGAVGRGEHTRIGTFLDHSVDSEISGNVIDLCPVGALTSKPFKFSARSWELRNHTGISPHDCVGANLNIQTLRGEVLRVLPRENPEVNDCWLADRDRFSYQALNSDQRLLRPMIKDRDGWREVGWESALKHAAAGLRTVIETDGAEQVGALASPTATLEEFYLLQKLMRSLGSSNIDHRLRQGDFRDDDIAPLFPASELAIGDIDQVKAALLVGSNIRKEQPLLGLRLRAAAVKNSARVMALNSVDYDFHFPLAAKSIVAPAELPGRLAALAAAVAKRKNIELPAGIKNRAAASNVDETEADETEADETMAAGLLEAGGEAVIILGAAAQQHPQAAALRAMADWLADAAGARLAVLPEGNGAAAWLAGCVPHRGPLGAPSESVGRNAAQMLADPLRGYLLLGVEPELDTLDGARALAAMQETGCVVQIGAFLSDAALDYADVLLPLATFAESAGSYVNCEGRLQQGIGAAPPKGEARPGWKILRVLGNYLQQEGFEQNTIEDVRAEIGSRNLDAAQRLAEWRIDAPAGGDGGDGLQRIAETPLYRVDATARRAPALQATRDNPAPAVHVNGSTLRALELEAGTTVRATAAAGSAELPLAMDERIPDGCVYVPAGFSETAALGGHGYLTVESA
ncbi:MAG: NADH-quinone oxidoreductase subunit NuoG [Pseudomonadota bacterium]|nr:NADH-quinone oxidoreductase subunit NuoG [Pseudomonadota bacterium]